MCQIEANSDVTGIGIRASIYTLCLASGVLEPLIGFVVDPKALGDFHRALQSALQIQGLALLCTAIYQTAHKQLTLFHVICVLHLLSLLGIGLTARGKYGHQGVNRRVVLWVLKILLAGAFMAFVGYVWVTAPHFGSQVECNATTIYVVFFVSINPTSPVFRYIILILMICAVLGIILGSIVTGIIAAICCGVRSKDRVIQSNDIAILTNIYRQARFKDKGFKRAALQSKLGDIIVRSIVNAYGVVMLELTVSRNDIGPDERKWTFGQILALFLLLGVVAEVANIILARLDSKSHQPRRSDEASHPLDATAQEGQSATEEQNIP